MLIKFDIKYWKPEDVIKTRDGHSVRIICTDYKGATGHTIVGLVDIGEGKEAVHEFMSNGRWLDSQEIKSDLDLFICVPSSSLFGEGDLVINQEGTMVLVGRSVNPRVLESIITINPDDLSERIEDSFDPDDFELAQQKDKELFFVYLALLGLKWDPEKKTLSPFMPEIEASPKTSGWEVSYAGKRVKITDNDFKTLSDLWKLG